MFLFSFRFVFCFDFVGLGGPDGGFGAAWGGSSGSSRSGGKPLLLLTLKNTPRGTKNTTRTTRTNKNKTKNKTKTKQKHCSARSLVFGGFQMSGGVPGEDFDMPNPNLRSKMTKSDG